ncbi:MAG TPA: glycoside hydrolase family 130 protein [Cyclobacteriaceae bacterium]|nr:glycoside hydrolase family 130 protein [Cyclobacteriaceae bacterium]
MRKTNYYLILTCLSLSILMCCQPVTNQETTWALLPFTKVDSLNPVLSAGDHSFTCPILQQPVRWDEKDVFNPAAVVRDGKVWLLFRAEDTIGKYAGTSRIGLAVSDDGLHFNKMEEPVLYPQEDAMKVYEWEGGIEDPRIVEREDSLYVLTYTAYDGKLARLCLATSNDLLHWKKEGLVLRGSYTDTWSKSGAIVARREGERMVATKVNGKYWMYWGDTDLFMATSDDLIHWTPVEVNGKLLSVLKPRPGYFDSRLVESGPFALLTEAGIVLPYNGMNLDVGGDTTLAKGAYCSGQALFALPDPSRLIDRLEKNFLRPDQPYEINGQVNQVCFIEGMVWFKDHWYLYYGTADSKIGVAVH